MRLTHIGLCVSDLDASLRFYRDRLGFREVSRLDVAGAAAERLLELAPLALRAVWLERDGTRVELLHYAKPGHAGDATPAPMNRLGLTHLSLRVADLDATLSELRGAGVRVLEATRVEIPEAGARAAFVTDPDGTRIELVEGGPVPA